MRHQSRIALVAVAAAQLAGQLAVEIVKAAVATEQRYQPLVLARVGGGTEPCLALEDGERIGGDAHLEAEPGIGLVEHRRHFLAQEVGDSREEALTPSDDPAPWLQNNLTLRSGP